MGQNRRKMELIQKENIRMNTFQKRKKSLVNKVKEFSVLCGVEACIIISEPKRKNLENQKLDATWPQNPDEVKRIINRYKTSNQPNRCYNIEDYFIEKKKKIDAEMSKLRRQIYETKYPSWNTHLDTFSEDQLRIFLAQLDKKLEIADQKLNGFQENPSRMMQLFNPQMINNLQQLEVGFPSHFQIGQSSTMMPQLFPSEVGFPFHFQTGQSSAMMPLPLPRPQLFSSFHEAVMTENLNNSDICNWDNLELHGNSHAMQINQNAMNQFGGWPSLSSYVNPSCLMPSYFESTSTLAIPVSPSRLQNHQIFQNCDQENKLYCNMDGKYLPKSDI